MLPAVRRLPADLLRGILGALLWASWRRCRANGLGQEEGSSEDGRKGTAWNGPEASITSKDGSEDGSEGIGRMRKGGKRSREGCDGGETKAGDGRRGRMRYMGGMGGYGRLVRH